MVSLWRAGSYVWIPYINFYVVRNGFTLNVFHFLCQNDNEVRVSSDLSEGEIKAIQKRRERVKTCLHELLDVHFDEVITDNHVKVKRITLP